MKGGTGGIWGGGGLAKHIKRPLAHNIHSMYTTLLTREDLSQAAHRDFTQGITMFTRSWKYKHTVQTKIFSQIIRCLINIKKSDLYYSTCHPWCLLDIVPIVRLVSELPDLFLKLQKQIQCSTFADNIPCWSIHLPRYHHILEVSSEKLWDTVFSLERIVWQVKARHLSVTKTKRKRRLRIKTFSWQNEDTSFFLYLYCILGDVEYEKSVALTV